MIGRLSGKLAAKHPPQVMVDCNGVAYEVDVPMSTFYALPATGEPVTLHTHLVVREDAQSLYGFHTLEERAVFRQLIRIAGVGARTALSVLSGMSVAELAQAVAQQEVAQFTRIPGIGKKTAERLLLELKGKLADARPAGAGAGGSERAECARRARLQRQGGARSHPRARAGPFGRRRDPGGAEGARPRLAR